MIRTIPTVLLLGACAVSPEQSAPTGLAGDVPGGLTTTWGEELGTDIPLAVYPRPTLVRRRWLNLNGTWEFEPGHAGQKPLAGRPLSGSILVPFPVESALSSVGEHHDHFWYRRTFELPEEWSDDRIWVHFGAVDWESEVWVNGHVFPIHRGGFNSIDLDITDALMPLPEQGLLVRVWDPTNAALHPVGLQTPTTSSGGHGPVSGIWQTVWVEPVPARGITGLVVEPELGNDGVRVTVQGDDVRGTDEVQVEVLGLGGLLAARRGALGEPLFISIPAPRPWSPKDPFLYDLRVTRIAADGRTREQVASYFALRHVEHHVGRDGKATIRLNGEPVFQRGVLDQGWWPDGLYTASSDEALRWDVATAKAMGFNMIRKYQKVEPERWYFWCDRLGMLVWQDIPGGENLDELARLNFMHDLERIVSLRRSHPSIVQWVVFDEGSGEFEVERISQVISDLDPSRLVDSVSGSGRTDAGDVIDVYGLLPPTGHAVSSGRVRVSGAYPGPELVVEGHSVAGEDAGVGQGTAADLGFAFENYVRRLERSRDEGLAAAVYAQLTDVERDHTGLVTYDRKVVKIDLERVFRANHGQMPALRNLLHTSEEAGQRWRFRIQEPSGDWTAKFGPALNLPGEGGRWQEGLGGFGVPREGESGVRTVWEAPEIWMLGEFTLARVPEGELVVPARFEGKLSVWINGVLATEASGRSRAYEPTRTGLRAEDVLRPGANQVAIHCTRTSQTPFIDVGLQVLSD